MKTRRRKTDEEGSLTVLMVQILLVLAEGARHGYAILQEIEERGAPLPAVGAATLYRSIARLREAGLVEEVESDEALRRPRRTYSVTPAGIERAKREVARLDRVVRWARAADLLEVGPGA